MKKTFRHTGVLMMVGVFALGLLGAAYTLWYEDLTLEADVSTGEFDVDWSCHDLNRDGANDTEDCNDELSGAGDEEGLGIVAVSPNLDVFIPEGTQGGPPDAKYTQRCDAALGDETDTNGDGDAVNGNTETLTLTMTGLYPYAGCRYQIDIHNSGTVPAHFTWSGLAGCDPKDSPLCDAISVDFGKCRMSVANGEPYHEVNLDFTDLGLLVVLGAAGEPVAPVQLHTSGRIWCDVDVWLEQADVEDMGPVTLWATITGHQWNEGIIN